MKRVNPKSIKISDEIEKRPKRGLLYFSLFVGCSKFGIFETINDLRSSASSAKSASGNTNVASYR